MKPEQVGLHLRDGGGVMGEMIRSKDWSDSALGPVEGWPQSLHTTLSICLASKFPMLIWWGPTLSVVYNDAYIPIWGHKHPWVLGRVGTDAWGEVWDVIGPMLEGVIERGEASWSEDTLLVLRRFGFAEECYFTWSYSPIIDETGGVGGAFTAVTETTGRVIGERRLKTLRELGERLAGVREVERASELALAIIAENPRDFAFAALYLLDPDGRRATRAAQTPNTRGHAGFPESLPVEDGVWPLASVIHSGSTEPVHDLASRIGDPPREAWPEAPRLAAVVPIARAGGRPYGVLIPGISPRLAYDDSYRGFLELAAGHVAAALAAATSYAEERRRAEALAELDRAKTSFFSNISHEFRTPLTLMLGPTEDALSSASRALTGEALEAVHRNELRLLKLVNALLDFSRIEAGRVQACYEPTDLAQLTRELASAFRSAMERAALRFEVRCDELGAPVYVDRGMWEKIVLNLLSNALKFTFEGRVRLELQRHEHFVELVVSDTGTGIPSEELPRLFERFHRVAGARARTHEGSGIGLALTSELVKLHGGTIEADSALGRGSRFVVRIPARREHLPGDRTTAGAHPQPASSGVTAFVEEALRWLPGDEPPPLPTGVSEASAISRIDGAAEHHDARILVADDNADMRDYLRRLLGERWRVTIVADGRLALEAARRERPDLILTDVMMPDLDGFGLLRALRADPLLATIPVLMLSARAGEESRIEGIEAGADDYLIKPFSARELLARVSNMLQLAGLRRLVELERNRLIAFIHQTPVGVAIWEGPELRCQLINDAYLRIAARPISVGATVRELFPELAASGSLARMERVFHDGVPIDTPETRLVLIGADGIPRERYFASSMRAMRDAADKIVGVITVTMETTEQVMARHAVEQSRAAAEAANRAKDEFLAMLGHELRNPLAPISTALELMRLRGTPGLERERAVIERQTQHLATLVEDLLDISRITRGMVQLKRERLSLAEIIARAVEISAPLFELQRHELVTDVARELVVEGDAARLTQVFANLLTNAAKYTDRGGRVVVTGRQDGSEVSITVTDTGRGMDAEMVPRVFDLFVQERQNLDRSRGGLGLGLAIVRNLVQLHGGAVDAASPGPGKGSTFRVRLPSSVGPCSEPRTQDSAVQAAADRPAPRGLAVLIVDDNTDAASLLSDLLVARGYQTRVTHDAAQALALAEDFVPDVALLDIGLPAMDGYELARRLRALPRWREVRLLAVTGYGQDSDRARSKASGFDHHLVKPISLASLEAVMPRSHP